MNYIYLREIRNSFTNLLSKVEFQNLGILSHFNRFLGSEPPRQKRTDKKENVIFQIQVFRLLFTELSGGTKHFSLFGMKQTECGEQQVLSFNMELFLGEIQ